MNEMNYRQWRTRQKKTEENESKALEPPSMLFITCRKATPIQCRSKDEDTFNRLTS